MNILITNIGRRVYLLDFLEEIKKKNEKINIHLADNDIFAASLSRKKILNTKYL